MTLRTIYFFETPDSIPGLFDTFFGGLFLVKGIPLIGQLALLLTIALTFWMALSERKTHRGLQVTALAAPFAAFFLLALFLIQPWDEVFINLRHSYQLAHAGRFSFNAGEYLEGTADFLPYFLVGLLGKLGLPLLDTAFALCLLGGALCLVFAGKIGKTLTGATLSPLFFLGLLFFTPVAFNSAHGFATSIFTAAILLSIYRVFLRKTPLGWIAVALLPLIRVEGILLALLFLALYFYQQKRKRPAFALLAFAVVLPFLIHSLVRIRVYHEVFPLPVTFKSCLGSPFFFAVGLRNLAADAIATNVVFALLLLTSVQVVCRRLSIAFPGRGPERKLVLCLALFSVPYYLSGGDWFPSYWGRYLFPFGFFLWIYTLSTLAVVLPRIRDGRTATVFLPALAFFVVSSLWPISLTWKMIDTAFAHRRTLARIHEPTIAKGHHRIQHLSQLGNHLKRSTSLSDRIGTSELATIPFYAEREAIDFLGLVNPTIARTPLRAPPSLYREFPMVSELPYLIFRRIHPDILQNTEPEILYTFDFILRDQIRDYKPYELDRTLLFTALDRWEHQLGGLIDTLYGGLPKILSLGYRPIVVKYSNDFVALYFVHGKILEDHLQRLRNLGFRGGEIRNNRPVAPSASERDALRERTYTEAKDY